MELTSEMYQAEVAAALKAFDLHIVSLDKSPQECRASLESLVTKAIKVYGTRPAGLRHGIALDKQLTVMLSQSETEVPTCAIYFNLHSPYQKRAAGKSQKQSRG